MWPGLGVSGRLYRDAVIEILSRAQLTAPVERLIAHPRLPLIAGVDLTRPAVHVWDLDLRPIGSVGPATAEYGAERPALSPELVWHPHEPILMVSTGETLTRWSPGDVTTWSSTYSSLAFSPDGGTLWASPAGGGGKDAWLASDVVDPAGGIVGTGPRWDTGVAEHPAGGLVLTLASDQGATLCLFARNEDRRMRIRSRALVLDVDGYATPVWSPDGLRFAVRGNNYAQTLEVFSFPELRCQLRITLREPDPNLATDPTEWTLAWLRHDIAFAADPNVLWIGTPHGRLISLDLATETATEHTVADAAVTAVARTVNRPADRGRP